METKKTKSTVDQANSFETSDLAVASFLKAQKIPIAGMRREGNRVFFQFSHPKAETIAFSYFNGAKVSASSYSQAFQELKTLLFGRIQP